MNLNELPEMLPDDFLPIDEDTLKKLMPHYAFYRNYSGRAEYTCSCCGGKSTQKNSIRHDDVLHCSMCHQILRARAESRGRHVLNTSRWFGIWGENDGTLILRVVQCFLNFSISEKPKFTYWNEYAYFFNKNKCVRYGSKYTVTLKNEYAWALVKLKTLAGLPDTFNRYDSDAFNSFSIGLEKVLHKTDLKYSEVLRFEHTKTFQQVDYLLTYTKKPTLEYIVKGGFHDLAKDITDRHERKLHLKAINWKSNNLLHMLGIVKKDLDTVKHFDCDTLTLWRDLRSDDPQSDSTDLKRLMQQLNLKRDNPQRWHMVHETTGEKISKINAYLQKQAVGVVFYQDYVHMEQQIVSDSGTAPEWFPKNIRKAHDDCIERIRFVKNQELDRKIASRKLDKYLMSYKNLIMKAPKSCQEIIDEGQTLKHCVGSYAERHAKGQTTILFIRHKDQPDKPLYTVEVSKDNKIIQMHGYRNDFSGKPKEMTEFYSKYKQFLEKAIPQ